MSFYLFRKLSSVIFLSIFALIVVKTTSAAIPARKETCKSVNGISPLLKRGNILLFGEMHGTQEIPAFIGDVVCLAIKKKSPVILGLEIPSDEQMAIDRFLVSKGGKEAEAQLTKGAFWHRKSQDGSSFSDGRTSTAMLQLMEQVRALRAASSKVRIVAYDQIPGSGSQSRDRVMAENLTHLASREPKSLLVVLSGDVHTRLTPGTSWNKDFEPMGYLLAKSINSSRINSFAVSHEGGQAWVCAELPPDFKQACKPLPLKPKPGATSWSVKLTAETNSPYTGTFGVGLITASRPVTGQSH
jgi:erythromycin esterase-like protein